MTTLLALSLVLIAFLVATAVLLGLGMVEDRRTVGLYALSAEERGRISFVFNDEKLLDASRAAKDLLSSAPPNGTDWSRLSMLLEPRFPNLAEWIGELADLGRMERDSVDGTSHLVAEWVEGAARITLASTGSEGTINAPDQHTAAAMARELETLRAATNETPLPMWQEDATGTILWCNAAYLRLAEDIMGDENTPTWPPERVLPVPTVNDATPDEQSVRIATGSADDDARRWFDIERRPFGAGQICTAAPADKLVKAETSLKEFVTTLSKTFASLPTGLAIFNRERELAMFNPAFLDLTSLPVEFLIAKPTLASVLDQLRASQMMPEPKDYKSWRQRVSDLVSEARNGTYVETWTLPGGQTYRVSGQPHPDGAVALLFEDISDEVGATRQQRTEIETAQAALDALPGAIAVYSPAGIVALANQNLQAVWGPDFDPGLSVFDALEFWQSASLPSAAWSDIRAAIGQLGNREPHQANATLKDGRTMNVRIVPLPAGLTMVEFLPAQAESGSNADLLSESTRALLGIGS